MTSAPSRRSVVLAALFAATSSRAQVGPPVEAGPFRPADLVEVATLDPTIRLDVRYATANNFMGRPFYAEARVFLQRPAAEALVRVHRALGEKGYGLLLFDGYRPWSVTKAFWDATPEAKKVFVADPKNGSRHNRGGAVDLSVFHLATGAPADMGGAYDEMSPRSYVPWDEGSKEVRGRRDLLRTSMEKEGFFVYPWEWWHFDWKDWRAYAIGNASFSELAASRTARVATAADLAGGTLVDLTHAFDARTLYWPTSPTTFELKTLSRGVVPAGFFYAANAFSAPEHGGTHLDAPVHFAEAGTTADALPLSRLVLPAVVVDVTSAAASDPAYRLRKEDVLAWETRHGRIPTGAAVLLRTGWSTRWPDRKAYFGDDTPGDASKLRFPGFGAEAAELLVNGRGALALGLDTPSLDHGPSRDFPVHRLAAAAGVAGFENLARLEALPETGALLVALPMKIAGGSGAPLRAVAVLPR